MSTECAAKSIRVARHEARGGGRRAKPKGGAPSRCGPLTARGRRCGRAADRGGSTGSDGEWGRRGFVELKSLPGFAACHDERRRSYRGCCVIVASPVSPGSDCLGPNKRGATSTRASLGLRGDCGNTLSDNPLNESRPVAGDSGGEPDGVVGSGGRGSGPGAADADARAHPSGPAGGARSPPSVRAVPRRGVARTCRPSTAGLRLQERVRQPIDRLRGRSRQVSKLRRKRRS